jgi:hypothetical protein
LPSFGCFDGVCRVGRAVGEACSATEPCAFTLICNDSMCASSVPSGGPCNRDEHCPSGELCLGMAGEQRCEAILPVGSPCDPAEDPGQCGRDGLCVDVSSGAPVFECRRLGRDGDRCDFVGCAADFWCRFGGAGDAPQGTCRPQGGPSDSCATTGERSSSPCTSGLWCIEDRCSPPSGLGEACNDPGTCEAGLWCRAAECVAPAAVGAVCAPEWDSACVASAYCSEAGRCESRRPDGALCTRAVECVSGGCTLDSTGTSRCSDPPMRCIRP